jgi:hypothetical protein
MITIGLDGQPYVIFQCLLDIFMCMGVDMDC